MIKEMIVDDTIDNDYISPDKRKIILKIILTNRDDLKRIQRVIFKEMSQEKIEEEKDEKE